VIGIRSPCHSIKRERQNRFRQLRANNGPNSRLDRGEVLFPASRDALGREVFKIAIAAAYRRASLMRETADRVSAPTRRGHATGQDLPRRNTEREAS